MASAASQQKLGFTELAVWALATVFSASTVASAKMANPKIKL